MCGVSDHLKRSAVLRAGVAESPLEILRGVIASGPRITEREEFALLSPYDQDKLPVCQEMQQSRRSALQAVMYTSIPFREAKCRLMLQDPTSTRNFKIQ